VLRFDRRTLSSAHSRRVSAELAKVPGLSVAQGSGLAGREPDILVERGLEKVVVELKRAPVKIGLNTTIHHAVTQVSLYLHEPDVVGAVVLVYSASTRDYEVTNAEEPLSERVRIVAPRILKRRGDILLNNVTS
jgi:hypothetical protein